MPETDEAALPGNQSIAEAEKRPAPSRVEAAIGELLQVFMQFAADIDDPEAGAAADAALARLDEAMASPA